jgi:ATP-dependent helicase/nuclease subunit B
MKDSEVIPVGMYYYHVDNPVVDGPGPMAIKKRGGDEALATYDELMKALKLDGVSRDEPHVLLRCHDLGLVSEKSGSIIGESTVIPVSVDKEGEYKSSAIVASEKSFDMLGAYSMKKMKEGAEEILAGKFSKNPISYEGKRGNACTYCGYKSVCRFGKTSGSEKSIPRNTDSIRSQIKEFETYAEVE